MQLVLKVIARTERADGTITITLADTAAPGTCSLVLAETADQPYRVGDRYELSLIPLARIAHPIPVAPRAGVRSSLDAVGVAGAKVTVETKS